MDNHEKLFRTKGVDRIKALGFSLMLSGPLSYLFYFILGNTQNIKSDAIPLVIGVTIFLIITIHAFLKPLCYLKIAYITGIVGFIGTILTVILSIFSIFS